MDGTGRGRRRRVATTAIGVVCATLALTPGLADAAVPSFAVTTADDAGGVGLCAVGGSCSLRQALAASGPAGGTVTLPAAVYELSLGQLHVPAAGGPITVVGAGAGDTALAQPGEDRVLDVAAGAVVSLSGVTVTGGDVKGADGADGTDAEAGPPATPATAGEVGGEAAGGGIRNAGDLTLTDVVVTGNRVTAGDGGDGGGDPAAIPGHGGVGGEARGGGIENSGRLRLVRAEVAENVAEAGRGGVDGVGPGGVVLGGAVGGVAGGGGIANTGSGVTAVVDSTVRDNRVVGGEGGGPAALLPSNGGRGGGGGLGSNGGRVTVTGSTFTGNVARGGASAGFSGGFAGGGGLATLGAPLVVRDSTVAGNRAAGGVYPAGASTGTGGGIWTDDTVTLEQVTLVGNVASASADGVSPTGEGGNVGLLGGRADVRGVLIADGRGAPSNCWGTLTAHGGNVEESAGAGDCGLEQTVADARLGVLAANGGPTETIALRVGSPAIGAGSCTTLEPAAVTRDQRGWPRPAQGCDAGAYEVVAPVVAAGAATDVGQTTATLHATASWIRPGSSVRYSYGVGDAGEQVAGEHAAPYTEGEPVAFSETVTGLRPGTTYRFRVTVTGPDGSSVAEGSFPTASAPTEDPLRRDPLRRDPSRTRSAPRLTAVAVGRRGGRSTLRFTLDRAARVTVAYRTAPARRRRARLLGSVTLAGRKGVNRVVLTGRVGRRVLSPGRYRLTLTAKADGRTSGARTVTYTVVRRARR